MLVKPDKIVIRGGKASWGYRLDDPARGVVAVRLRLGDAPTWCAAIPPRSAERDRIDLFDGVPNAPVPAACPTLP